MHAGTKVQVQHLFQSETVAIARAAWHIVLHGAKHKPQQNPESARLAQRLPGLSPGRPGKVPLRGAATLRRAGAAKQTPEPACPDATCHMPSLTRQLAMSNLKSLRSHRLCCSQVFPLTRPAGCQAPAGLLKRTSRQKHLFRKKMQTGSLH